MKNRWNDTEAARFTDDLQLRVYSSRLLGQDPSLVLHGGGNTSVKIRQPDLFGEAEEILYVKGSGWDLATIEAAGYTPVRMAHLLRLAELESLSDLEMVNQLKTHQTLASAPTASVEAILHATLPYKFVDHTHADAIITITNTKDGEARIREIYGDELVIIPYVMPGFDLARLVAKAFPKQVNPNTIGMVLMNHGLFSFGESAKESYERMITLVQRAEAYLQAQGAWQLPEALSPPPPDTSTLSALRQSLSEAAGQPMLLQSHRSPEAMSFCGRDNLATISQQGPATPDHVIRTKRLPMLGSDVAAYAKAYRDYFEQQSPQARNPVQILDPAPRVVLDPQLGMLSVGKSAKEAGIVADIYHHTMQIIQRAEQLGGWRALPASDIFDVEYWELEQAKLRTGGTPPPFQGEIALVTGAASGIGKACVESLLARGAAVVGLDLNPEITGLYDRAEFLGIRCDVTDSNALKDALEQTLLAFGGLDMLILNAGIFPGGCPVAELTDEQWRKVMQVNLDANLSLLRECHSLLLQAPRHGRVVVIGSKNVPAPGAGAAAYSASKAALNQLARIVALEWAADGIRINSLHPDAVFDTGIWSDQVLQARADHYGMSVAEYKTRNLLKTEVTSRDVAELAAELCGELFAKTTAAQIPVDGGNDRVV
ncbi:bifunctional aldolase/short-chain dehydrogenase [Candidatus Endoriftia persephonae]|jgi:rhamnose utilization protein RhaD (predicted bifunctional aldolase and dehydrogenase)/NAD(P)-dependent dehydrogenase (short-subunit alcohol dehydrogenase family)|uniref:Bifunctional aldolase/short-chain dehydrogenase n=2 Tax=Gammaproteobacteria TaxID=1236 RepID=A0A9J6ZZY5_9GAMM|nr:bifunctional aldolase/short-chain dehydrogenase [Candidatus Endoriftia persephone]EGW55104.1 putative oxidoreductase YuxG [endosymbiont of Tevnia jerichonana (vent Tica)]USF88290.1 bifunctional aldolase/short-chain dehydrogenase [Candidatus Endoriftia persephone]